LKKIIATMYKKSKITNINFATNELEELDFDLETGVVRWS
jgi:hypothetical protein